MSPRAIDELRDVLARGSADPLKALEAIKRAHEISCTLADAPYSASMMYLPGLFLPSTKIIEVPSITQLAGGGTEADFPVQIQTPGVCVGILGGILEAKDSNTPGIFAGMKFQLGLETERFFASNGNSNAARASFAVFGGMSAGSSFMPVMIPCRGSGNWTFTLRNDNADPATAIINLAFLEGRSWLEYCRA